MCLDQPLPERVDLEYLFSFVSNAPMWIENYNLHTVGKVLEALKAIIRAVLETLPPLNPNACSQTDRIAVMISKFEEQRQLWVDKQSMHCISVDCFFFK